MSCSQKKIEANRRNARKSTGPKTAEGKARSSRNAISHGLTAQLTPVVLDESQGEFDAFAEDLFADLRPRGAMQRVIADRIIFVSWKLRRIPRIEGAMFAAGPSQGINWPGPHPDVPPEEVAELVRILDEGNEEPADEPKPTVAQSILQTEEQVKHVRALQLYEMRLERSLHASLRELSRLKKLQREENEANDEDDCDLGVDELPTPQVKNHGALRETGAMRATPPDQKSEDFTFSSPAPVPAPAEPISASSTGSAVTVPLPLPGHRVR